MKIKHKFPKSVGCSKSSSKREDYRDTGLPQEARKISSKQPKLPSKKFEKKEQSPKLAEERK